ncbi:hypothetical protein EYC59_03390 [Candidatus Saccharibacteria bacterium]|nr:MAG: hypothetical protein EYC59_03390 [Candidatus Saccharibacteria bacterium]
MADFAHRELPMVRPIAGLKLGVRKLSPASRPVRAFADPDVGSVTLFLNPENSAEEVVADMARAMMHEATHVAHGQYNPTFMEDAESAGLRNFGHAVVEGIALAVEEGVVDAEGFVSDGAFQYTPQGLKVVRDALVDVLYDEATKQQEHYEFLFGDDAFYGRGYEIGMYVVGNMTMDTNYSAKQMLEAPFSEYVEFAETRL